MSSLRKPNSHHRRVGDDEVSPSLCRNRRESSEDLFPSNCINHSHGKGKRKTAKKLEMESEKTSQIVNHCCKESVRSRKSFGRFPTPDSKA
ncbi:hypothetical protein CEXT_159311 [Caerostris extrusa]|uniref:Uncharacterized protein n=1 Tax=Caerostris extrusa TaxID=172846 RepID=A0AAV4NZI2_CAEEX|nr:hypothetical protein CEXT_159311 [Caerostris extrusa]